MRSHARLSSTEEGDRAIGVSAELRAERKGRALERAPACKQREGGGQRADDVCEAPLPQAVFQRWNGENRTRDRRVIGHD